MHGNLAFRKVDMKDPFNLASWGSFLGFELQAGLDLCPYHQASHATVVTKTIWVIDTSPLQGSISNLYLLFCAVPLMSLTHYVVQCINQHTCCPRNYRSPNWWSDQWLITKELIHLMVAEARSSLHSSSLVSTLCL